MYNKCDKCDSVYAAPFAAWDIRLFLDTHPCDREALKAYSELCGNCGCTDNYACLPARFYDCDRWRWIDDPWPWEFEANCRNYPISRRAN